MPRTIRNQSFPYSFNTAGQAGPWHPETSLSGCNVPSIRPQYPRGDPPKRPILQVASPPLPFAGTVLYHQKTILKNRFNILYSNLTGRDILLL